MTVAASAERQLSDYSLVGPQSEQAVALGLADARWYATPIPREQMQALLERRDGPAIRDTLIWFVLLLGTAAAGIALWPSWLALIPFALYGVLYASSSDSRWHEAGHGTAFKTDWMNNGLYELASFMVLRESVPWRWSHARHHSDTIIVGRDAEIALQRPMTWASLAGKFVNLPGFFHYFRTVFLHSTGKLNRQEATYIPASEAPKVFWRARLYLLVYAAVILAAIASRSILPLMLIGLPTFYGAWLMVVYGLTQHAGLAENVLDHRLNTRTVYMNPINRFLYWNMGYHIEHHMFPMVPYHNLSKLHELTKFDTPPAFNGLADAYREIIPGLKRVHADPNYYIPRELPPQATQEEEHRAAEVVTSAADADADGWVQVCAIDRLLPGDALRFEHTSGCYTLYRSQIGQFFASAGMCTHGNAYLADGYLQGTVIECPKHNGRFDVRDGSVKRPPPRTALRTYPAREKDGRVQVNVAMQGG